MTNIEAIIEDMQPFPVRRSLAERKCVKYHINANEEVTDEKTIALIVIEILIQMKTLNNIAEGGVSVSFDAKQVDSYILSICNQHGFDSSDYFATPTVTYLGDI